MADNNEFKYRSSTINLTNKVAPVDYAALLHSALQGTEWEFFLGKTKFKDDIQSKASYSITDDIAEKLVNKTEASNFVNDPIRTWNESTQSYYDLYPVSSYIEETGMFTAETDLLLHEVYRYLGWDVLDTPKYLDILTNNEVLSFLQDEAVFINSNISDDAISVGTAAGLSDSVSLFIRHLANTANNRLYAGSLIGIQSELSVLDIYAGIFKVATSCKNSIPWSKLPVRLAQFENPVSSVNATSNVQINFYPYGLAAYELPISRTSTSQISLYSSTTKVGDVNFSASSSYTPYNLPNSFKVLTNNSDYNFTSLTSEQTKDCFIVNDNRYGMLASYTFEGLVISDEDNATSYYDMLNIYDNFELIKFYSTSSTIQMVLPQLSDCIAKSNLSSFFYKDVNTSKLQSSKSISCVYNNKSDEIKIIGFNTGSILFSVTTVDASLPSSIYEDPLLITVSNDVQVDTGVVDELDNPIYETKKVQVAIVCMIMSNEAQQDNNYYLAKIISIPKKQLDFEPIDNGAKHDYNTAFSDKSFFDNCTMHLYPLSYNQTEETIDCEESVFSQISMTLVDFYIGDFAIGNSSSAETILNKSILSKTESETWTITSPSQITSTLATNNSNLITANCTYCSDNVIKVSDDSITDQCLQCINLGDYIYGPGISSTGAYVTAIDGKYLTVSENLPTVGIGKTYTCYIYTSATLPLTFSYYDKTLSSKDIIESSITDRLVLDQTTLNYELNYEPLYAYNIEDTVVGDLWSEWANTEKSAPYQDRILSNSIKRILYYATEEEQAANEAIIETAIANKQPYDNYSVYNDSSEIFFLQNQSIIVELNNTTTYDDGYISSSNNLQAISWLLHDRLPASTKVVFSSNTSIAFNTADQTYSLQRPSIGAISTTYNNYDGYAMYIQLGSDADNEDLSKYQRLTSDALTTIYSDNSSLQKSVYNDNLSADKSSVYLGSHMQFTTNVDLSSLNSYVIESSLNPLQSLTNIEINNYKFDLVNYFISNEMLTQSSDYILSSALSYDTYNSLDVNSLNEYYKKSTKYNDTEESSSVANIKTSHPFACFLMYETSFSGSLTEYQTYVDSATDCLTEDEASDLQTKITNWLKSDNDISDGYTVVVPEDTTVADYLLKLIKSHFVAVTSEQYHVFVAVGNSLYLIVVNVTAYNEDSDEYVANIGAVYCLDAIHLSLINTNSYNLQYELSNKSLKELTALKNYINNIYLTQITIDSLGEFSLYDFDLQLDPLCIAESNVFYDIDANTTVTTDASYAYFGSSKLFYNDVYNFPYVASPIWTRVTEDTEDAAELNKTAFFKAVEIYKKYLNDPTSVTIKTSFDESDENKYDYVYYIVTQSSNMLKYFKNTLNFYCNIQKVESNLASDSNGNKVDTYYKVTSNDTNFNLSSFTIGDKVLSVSTDGIKVRNAYKTSAEGLMFSSTVDFSGYVRGLRKVNDAWYYLVQPDLNARLTLEGLYETDDLSTLPFDKLQPVSGTLNISKTPLVDNSIKYFRNALIAEGHSNTSATSTIYFEDTSVLSYLTTGDTILNILEATDYDKAKAEITYTIDASSIYGILNTGSSIFIATDYASFDLYDPETTEAARTSIDAFNSFANDSAYASFVRDNNYVIETVSDGIASETALLTISDSSIALDSESVDSIITEQGRTFFKHTSNNAEYYYVVSDIDLGNVGSEFVPTADILPANEVSMIDIGQNADLLADAYANGIPLTNDSVDANNILRISSSSTSSPKEFKIASVGSDVYFKSRSVIQDTDEAYDVLNDALMTFQNLDYSEDYTVTDRENIMLYKIARTFAATTFDNVEIDDVSYDLSNDYYWKKVELPKKICNVHKDLMNYESNSSLYAYTQSSFISSVNLLASLFDDSITGEETSIVESSKANEEIIGSSDETAAAKKMWLVIKNYVVLQYNDFTSKVSADDTSLTLPLPLVKDDDTYAVSTEATTTNINDLTLSFTGNDYTYYTSNYPTTEARYRLYLEFVNEYLLANVPHATAFSNLKPVYIGDVVIDNDGSVAEVSHSNLDSGADIIEKTTTDNLVFITSNGIFNLSKLYTYRTEDVKNQKHWTKASLPSYLFYEYQSTSSSTSITYDGVSIPTVSDVEQLQFFAVNDIVTSDNIIVLGIKKFKRSVVRNMITTLLSNLGETNSGFTETDYDNFADDETCAILYSIDGGESFSLKSFNSDYANYTVTGLRVKDDVLAVGLKSITSTSQDAEVVAYIDCNETSLVSNDFSYTTSANVANTDASFATKMTAGTTHTRLSNDAVLDGNLLSTTTDMPAVIATAAIIQKIGTDYVICDRQIFNNDTPDNTNVYISVRTADTKPVPDPFVAVDRKTIAASVLNKLVDSQLVTYSVDNSDYADLCYLPDSYLQAFTNAYYKADAIQNSAGEKVYSDEDLKNLIAPKDEAATMNVTFTYDANTDEDSLDYIPFTVSNATQWINKSHRQIKLCDVFGQQYVNIVGQFAAGEFIKFTTESVNIWEQDSTDAFNLYTLTYEDIRDFYAAQYPDDVDEVSDTLTMTSYETNNNLVLVPVSSSNAATNLLLTVPQVEFNVNQTAELDKESGTYMAVTASSGLREQYVNEETANNAGLKVGTPTYIMATCEDVFGDEFSTSYSGTVSLVDDEDASQEHEVEVALENSNLAKWFNFKDRFKLVKDVDTKEVATAGYVGGCFIYDSLYDCFVTGTYTDPAEFKTVDDEHYTSGTVATYSDSADTDTIAGTTYAKLLQYTQTVNTTKVTKTAAIAFTIETDDSGEKHIVPFNSDFGLITGLAFSTVGYGAAKTISNTGETTNISYADYDSSDSSTERYLPWNIDADAFEDIDCLNSAGDKVALYDLSGNLKYATMKLPKYTSYRTLILNLGYEVDRASQLSNISNENLTIAGKNSVQQYITLSDCPASIASMFENNSELTSVYAYIKVLTKANIELTDAQNKAIEIYTHELTITEQSLYEPNRIYCRILSPVLYNGKWRSFKTLNDSNDATVGSLLSTTSSEIAALYNIYSYENANSIPVYMSDLSGRYLTLDLNDSEVLTLKSMNSSEYSSSKRIVSRSFRNYNINSRIKNYIAVSNSCKPFDSKVTLDFNTFKYKLFSDVYLQTGEYGISVADTSALFVNKVSSFKRALIEPVMSKDELLSFNNIYVERNPYNACLYKYSAVYKTLQNLQHTTNDISINCLALFNYAHKVIGYAKFNPVKFNPVKNQGASFTCLMLRTIPS